MARVLALVALVLIVAGRRQPAQPAQPPAWKGKNLQYFPKDIARDRLLQRMKDFSFALGVRCQYCHAGGDPESPSLDDVVFQSDDKPEKAKARAMLRMVDQINHSLLPAIPFRAEPAVTVDCVTCHRGLPVPKTLQTTLFEITDEQGVAAAIAKYRELRRDAVLTGRYNFGEWEINELAARLREAGKLEAAIAILEMNGEYYPESAAIDFQIAEIHLARGEREKALARYRAVLEKSPNHAAARQRIAELEKRENER